MRLLKQSDTAQPLLFLLVSSTDHITPVTGISPTVTLSKAGGSFASPSGAVTEIANGWYKVAGNATDTNTLGPLILHATGTGADPCDVEYEIVAFNPQDSVRAGLTALPNAAAEASGGLYTRGTGAGQIQQDANGRINTNTTAIGGSTGTLTNFSSAYNGNGYGILKFTTTVSATASNTSLTLTDGPNNDGSLVKGDLVVIRSAANQKDAMTARVSSYSAGGGIIRTLTLIEDPNSSYTIVSGDTVSVYADVSCQPTTLGRTLDVSAGGEAGIDWANIGSKTTTNALTGTTISNTQAITSVSGAVGSVTGNVGGNVAGSVGSVTGNVGGNVSGSVGSVASEGITAASIASNAITAAKIATDAIGAAQLAADAVTEIQSGLATSSGVSAILTTLGTPANTTVSADIAAVKTDTGTLTSRITSTLFSGITYLSKWLGALAGKTADSGTLTEIQTTTAGAGYNNTTDSQEALRDRGDAAWATATGFSTLDAAGVRSAVGLSSANLDTQLAAIAGYIDTEVAAIKAKTDNLPSDPADASDIAASFTKIKKYLQLIARKDAAIATDNSTELGEINADGGSGAGSFDNTTDSEQAIRDRGDAAWTTGGGGSAPTAAENATAVWTSLLAGSDFSTTGSIGKLLKDDVDAAISTRAPSSTALSTAQWTNTLATNLGTLASHDPGSTLAAASAVSNLQTDVTAIAGYVDTEVAAIKLKTDNLPSDPADQSQVEAAISSAVSGLASQSSVNTLIGYVDTEIAAIKAKTDNLPASPAATGDIPSAATIASQVRTELGVELARVDVAVSTRLATSGYTAPPTSSQNASAVAAQITTDHGSGSYVRNTEPLDATATQSAAAAALVAYDPPTGAELEYVKKVVEADVVVDKTQTPWEIVWREKGTATELFRKQLKDVDGANVTSTSTVIGQAVEE